METPTFYIHGNIGQPDPLLAGFKDLAPKISAKDVNEFLQANLDAEALTIAITSDGGSVAEGLAIYDAIKAHPANITTVTNRANSIASVIFLAGNERLVTEGVQFMVHNAWLEPAALGDMPLNVHSIAELHAEIKAVDDTLLDIYAKYTDADMAEMMAKETYLKADQLLEMGIATGKTAVELMALANSKPIAYTAKHIEFLNLNHNQMTDVTEKVNGLEKTLKSLLNLFKGSVKNMVAKTESGQALYIFTENPEELEGAKIVLADGEGNPTEEAAPDGAHTLEGGQVVTVEAGVITGVSVAESIEDLKAAYEEKEEEMKAEMEEKDKEILDLKNQLSNLGNEVKKVMADFEAFKNEVPGYEPKKKPAPAHEKEWDKMTASERILHNLKNELKK
jgi:ATP-dependent protease ClpP protease subunit/archaellum component FlaC